MPKMTTLRVFVNAAGEFGNPVGVLIDESQSLSTEERVALTAKTGYSECIFIENVADCRIRTYTGQQEISFAGHAALGAAHHLAEIKHSKVDQLKGPDGVIAVSESDGLLWVGAELRTTPPWWHERLPDVETLERLDGPQSASQVHTQLWAWKNETDGVVRSRTFAPDWGIPEDEANGSGCMRLAAALGRQLEIVHGCGSVIFTRPSSPGEAEVGGRVIRDSEDVITA